MLLERPSDADISNVVYDVNRSAKLQRI